MTTSNSANTAGRQARRLARKVFGFKQLRAGQEEAIKAVLEGHDTLAVMPTGSGKSAIYQIAALSLDGPTVIVSPLIALQRDQVDALEQIESGQAALLNSTLKESQREEVLRAFEAGELEFLFLAPEQFVSEDTLACLRRARPSLFVVDEAHCISEWGFDFRPEYLRLERAIDALGRPTILALTATAAPPVRAEIVERLGMRGAQVIVSGFDRPNLDLQAEQFEEDGPRRAALIEYVVKAAKPGLVYAATRKKAEEIAQSLCERGVRAAAYHAGLNSEIRETVQAAFMGDEWDVVVATTAFGMGIDKPNVRFVAHADLPGSLDAYYQEIGRAGRDGQDAEARLFFAETDLRLRKFFAQSAPIEEDDLERLVRLLEAADRPVTTAQLAEVNGMPQTKFLAALSRLEEVGAIRTLKNGKVKLTGELDAHDAAAEAATAQQHRREYDRSRLEMMRGYAGTSGCRREYLLGYFGQAFTPPCERCDNCRAGRVHAPSAEGPFAVGARVRHTSFGEGQVMHVEEDKLTVLFDERGYQTLALGVVLENRLLETVD
ncbi:RecQ family ATP-dependent DNA helicase [Deinococcus peraridilitoris]|uniref:ATP-dependent DNA helicase RecQ n=1 Tax=Deinococcus peraridilitoris (strain DSM 19664 / LMG 22246 / CIP 109416 / KR-200) TaxID=937777 RepID=L0A180_DEIPD|nr:ATP-dependent DNA helicase RecQ [Deinococcus peraridilitoris]AFZ67633.1 ATP-dependent DNA helicase, RecQ family [Deinococcus peraridilitoris DSM 19664]